MKNILIKFPYNQGRQVQGCYRVAMHMVDVVVFKILGPFSTSLSFLANEKTESLVWLMGEIGAM